MTRCKPSARAFGPLVIAGALATASACDGSTVGAPPPVDESPAMIEPDDSDTIPCGPRRALETVCQRCHSNPPRNGAPFPLVRRSDIVRVTADGEIRVRMIEQLEVGRMPLAPATIDYNAREALLDWLHDGAPAEAPHTCAASDAGAPDARPEPNEAVTNDG